VQPGLIAALTARDMEREAIGNLTIPAPMPGGAGLVVPHRPALAGDCVRHVGEAVALVVADTEAAARDAAERVVVEYEERSGSNGSEAFRRR
jgi:carbon-monoxide dehydrogenase large subunit